MKRRQLLIILTTALLTTGCSSLNTDDAVSEADNATSVESASEAESEPEAEPEETPEEEPVITYELAYAYEDQLEVINDNCDLWKLTEEDQEVFSPLIDYGYAIDDLDRDGYLEVIKTFWGGETMLYRTSVYETTDDRTLIEWDMDAFRKLDIEPCISELDGVYVIEGERIDRMLGYTNLDSEKGFSFFQKFMKEQKLIDRMKQLGLAEGDTVRVGGLEFEYYE